MASARNSSDFEGITLEDIEKINENNRILFSDESDVNINEYLSDEEDFENVSYEKDAINMVKNYNTKHSS